MDNPESGVLVDGVVVREKVSPGVSRIAVGGVRPVLVMSFSCLSNSKSVDGSSRLESSSRISGERRKPAAPPRGNMKSSSGSIKVW